MGIFCVTGGAGFIGSNLVGALLARGDRVRVVDDLSTGYKENLREYSDDIEFDEVDICETNRLREVFAGVDVVFHEAAIPSVQKSILNPQKSNRANIDGTLSVLVAARDAKVRRVVLAASSSPYGENPTLPKTESMVLRPISPYGVTKMVGELYAQLFTRLYGLETLALRYFNVFGPRQDPTSEYSGVLSKFITAMMDGRPPVIFGDGEQSRDFTYVDNVVSANLLAAETSKGIGEVVNIGTGHRYSLKDTVRILNGIFGSALEARFDSPRPGDIKHSMADIARAREWLGYSPLIDFETGLRRTVEWYRQHRAKGKTL
jgi:UDP-glucose 4-epimerase